MQWPVGVAQASGRFGALPGIDDYASMAAMADKTEMKSTARRQFDGWADTYDRSLLNQFLFRPSYRIFLEEIYAIHSRHPRPFRLLDVGCGTGTLAGMVVESELPAEVVGLDYAPAMCRTAHSKAVAHGHDGDAWFVAGDSERLPFENGSFDFLTCSNSFHHYPHQQEVVCEFRRVLKPGGHLLLIDGFRDNVIGWVAFDVIIAAVEKDVYHAPWSVIYKYFETAGFQDIQRRKFNFWMPAVVTIGRA
jgi:ubiquinone/menaquinone biosynthesis C-methylase UbiE